MGCRFSTLHTFAGLSVRDGLRHVSVVALFAVVAVAPCRVVPAVQADSSAFPPGEFVKLHVETTAPCMEVTIAGCGKERSLKFKQHILYHSQVQSNQKIQIQTSHKNMFPSFFSIRV